MSESEVQTAILKWLKQEQEAGKLIYWRVPLGGVRHGGVRKASPMRGHPDIGGVLKGGRYFAIEVKTDSGTFNHFQMEWALRLQRIGVLYLVATTLEDVVKALS